MTTANDARKAHKILDDLFNRKPVLDEEREFLRRSLPELPKQKTLQEILEEVESAACSVTDNYWSPSANPQDWLWELHAQLKGLKDVPANTPALPAGMRIADHPNFGRVVVSPATNGNGECLIFVLTRVNESGASWGYVEHDSLTFIDTEPAESAEPAEPARPEFLETEADYENAPEGTIVAKDDISTAWIKRFGAWKSTDGDRGVRCPNWKVGRRRVLRWGWGK